jgi:hypothetical protein
MKKRNVLFAGIMILALVFAACSSTPAAGSVEKSIMITGITDEFTNGFTRTGVFIVDRTDRPLNQTTKAIKWASFTGESTLIVDLMRTAFVSGDGWVDYRESTTRRWTGSGSYYILLYPAADRSFDGNGYAFTNGGNSAEKVDINTELTTLDLSQFKSFRELGWN